MPGARNNGLPAVRKPYDAALQERGPADIEKEIMVMASIDELRVLTDNEPIWYGDKMLVYFIFEGDREPVILTCRYVAERDLIIDWLKKSKKNKNIRIVIVWPGQWRSEAFLCDPVIALEQFRKEGKC